MTHNFYKLLIILFFCVPFSETGNLVAQQTIELKVLPYSSEARSDDQQYTFPTLETAVAEALKLRQNASDVPINILMLPGEHYLTSPITLSSSLNGLTIKGVGTSEVSVKGSVPVSLKWKKYDDNIFETTISEIQDFDQLLINGQPQILARYPDFDEEGGYWQGYAEDAISKDRIATWGNPIGGIFHVMHRGKWGGFHYKITGVDENGEAILEGGHQNNRPSKPHETFRMVENVFEELTSPGEWFYNKKQSKLYFWPAVGQDVENAKIELVILKNLISLKGSLEKPVKNITIEGISFENTQRTLFEEYEPLLRSDWTIFRGGAFFIEGTENCTLANNEFSNLAGNAIFVSGYNRKLSISNNHIHDCGASGISLVGDPSAVRSPSFQYSEFVPFDEMDTIAGPQNEHYPSSCQIDNNLIYRTGRVEKQTAGVQIAMAMDITVSHNSIYEVPRAGINIGDGTWGGHVIEHNDVFKTVLETGDHGAFNSWGRDRIWHPKRDVMDSLTSADPLMPFWDAIHPTVIRNNRFRCDHGWDIDLDDGSSNYHIYNNVCLNGGLKLREGFYRTVENNIMVNNTFHPHVWFVNSGDVFRRNIVEGAHRDIRLQGWGKEIDYNLFPSEIALLRSRINKVDEHSLFGDPMFIDSGTMDYRVAEGSPAFKLGFRNFPMDDFGVQDQRLKQLAETPDIPKRTKVVGDGAYGARTTFSWFGAELKDIEDEAEASAFGLPSSNGIVVQKIDRGSIADAAGLKEGDVILKVSGMKTNNLAGFLKIQIQSESKQQLAFIVMRNQIEIPLNIKIR